MPLVRLQYNGTARYFETPITGTQQSWMPGQSGFVDDSFEAAFIATGLFSYYEKERVFKRKNSLVTDDGSPISTGSGSVAASYWFAGTWAGLRAATTADLALGSPTLNSGYNVALVTDFGGPRGMEVSWTGARWKWQSGFVLDRIDIPVTLAATTSEQLVKTAARIPAGFLAEGDRIEVRLCTGKTAAGTETLTTRMRIGSTGTFADAQIVSRAGAANAQEMFGFVLAVMSPTQLRPMMVPQITAAGTTAAPAAFIWGSTDTTVASNITVDSLNSETLLTFTQQMSGSTQTPRVNEMMVVLR
ncbi:hypothetical protein [uncultured Aquabacterium sp.]|uniref:hypothetical protein n=1 Tax=uncultured Aquabacterium sp. TaxID=158753 RepID=UPI0025EBBEDF|nr:hypothetical protein [uncultured Aquabacterium sp.]